MPHPLLIESFQTVPAFRALAASLPRVGERALASGLAGSSVMVMLAALHRVRPERIWLLVAGGPEDAEQAASDLEALLGEAEVFLYPQRESLPYEEGEPHLEIGGARVEALEALLSGRARLMVTTARAMQELSPAVDGLRDLRLEIKAGDTLKLPELSGRLEDMGFERVATVEEVGQFALRGGIVDVFGFGTPEPARIELLGDEVDSIRFFDILTQLSVRAVDHLQLLPVDLKSADGMGDRRSASTSSTASPVSTESAAAVLAPSADGERRSLLDYVPEDTVVVHLHGTGTRQELERTWAEVVRLHESESSAAPGPRTPERLFFPPPVAERRLDAFPQLYIDDSGDVPLQSVSRFRALPPEPIDRDMGRLGEVLKAGGGAGRAHADPLRQPGAAGAPAGAAGRPEGGAHGGAGDRLHRRRVRAGGRGAGHPRADGPRDLSPLAPHPPPPAVSRRARRWRAWRRSSRATTWCTWTTASASSGGWSGCGWARRSSRRW